MPMAAILATLLSCLSTLAMSDPVLRLELLLLIPICLLPPLTRYKLGSCNSLEPVYVEENWHYPGGDVTMVNESLFDAPKKSRVGRNPPISIEIEFDQYRRNREYMSKGERNE